MTITQLTEKYKLTLWSTHKTSTGKEYHYLDDFGINIIINPETKEFSLRWMIPRSIFTIECPSCSPYDNEEHFDKIYNKFLQTVFRYKNN